MCQKQSNSKDGNLCYILQTSRYYVILERSVHGFILAQLGSFLFADKKGVHVHLCFHPFLQDLTQTMAYSWGSAILVQLYRELCRASLDHTRGIKGCITPLQVSITLFYYILIHVHNVSLVCLILICLFCMQLWSCKRLHMGQPDFGQLVAHLAPPVAHALHYDDVDGNVAEAVHDGLPVDATTELEPTLPLGCRCRVPLTRVHNPSGVLLIYRD